MLKARYCADVAAMRKPAIVEGRWMLGYTEEMAMPRENVASTLPTHYIFATFTERRHRCSRTTLPVSRSRVPCKQQRNSDDL